MSRISKLIKKFFIKLGILDENKWFKLSTFDISQDDPNKEWKLAKAKLEALDDNDIFEIIEKVIDTKTAKGLYSLSDLFLAWELEEYWPELSFEKKALLINLINAKFYEGIDSNKFSWVKKRLEKMDLLQLLYIYSAALDNTLKLFIANNFNNIMLILNLIMKEGKCYFNLKKNLIKNILKFNSDNIAQIIIDFYEGNFY